MINNEGDFGQIDKLGQFNAPPKMFEYASTDDKPGKGGDKKGASDDLMFHPMVMAPDTIRLA